MQNIIKHETKGMNDVQLENLANKERQILIDRINEQSLNEDFANDLLLHDGHSSTISRNSIRSNDYLTISKLRNMKRLEKKRGKRYKKEYLSEINQICEEFPNSHNVIRKALRIPRTSFKRISKRIEKFGTVNEKNKSSVSD